MNVDDIDTYSPGAVVNFQRSDGSIVSAKILGASERSADYPSFTYECSGTVVTNDRAPLARRSFPHVRTPSRPTSAPIRANQLCSSVRSNTQVRKSGTPSLLLKGGGRPTLSNVLYYFLHKFSLGGTPSIC